VGAIHLADSALLAAWVMPLALSNSALASSFLPIDGKAAPSASGDSRLPGPVALPPSSPAGIVLTACIRIDAQGIFQQRPGSL